jgi:hypothetical protein
VTSGIPFWSILSIATLLESGQQIASASRLTCEGRWLGGRAVCIFPTLQISGGLGVEMRTGLPLAVRCIWLFGGQTHKQALSPYLTALLKRSSTRKEVAEVLVIVY